MIDIILATHNGECYLIELLNSILNQTYSDFRIIVGDDNSNDSTREILKNYSKQYPDKFELHFFEYKQSSAKANFFRLLEFSDADYTMFADQDDVWHPNKISVTFELMKKAECTNIPVLVHTDLTVVDRHLNTICDSMFKMQRLPKKWDRLCRLLVQNNVTGCTVMINRNLTNMIKVGNIDSIIMHDWWIALIAVAFGRIEFLEISTVLYRQHLDNEVGAKNVSSIGYFDSRIKNTDSIRKNLNDTYIQCKAFLDMYRGYLNDDAVVLLEQYYSLMDSSALKRIIVLNKYGLKKNTLIRRIGQIIWG